VADEKRGITIIPGGQEEKKIANFVLKIQKDTFIEKQDGTCDREYVLLAKSANWEKEFEISAKQYMEARDLKGLISSAAGSMATFKVNHLDDIRLAGQQISTDVVRDTRISAFGYYKGQYVSPTCTIKDGKIFNNKDLGVNISLHGADASSRITEKLDFRIASQEDVRSITKQALQQMVALYELELAGTSLGAVSLSIIQEMPGISMIWDSRLALWITGPSGSGKTELALMPARFFGEFTKPDIPTWGDTANAVERQLIACGSAVMIADDWKADILSDQEMDRAKRVIQMYNSGHGRERLKSTGELIKSQSKQ
jgi:hypothetical protein